MKNLRLIIALLLLGFCFSGISQPFELDPKIKPIKLQLQENNKHPGEKGIATLGTVKDSAKYYYVTGHHLFQPVDVFIFGHDNKQPLVAELVKDTWGDIQDKQSTDKSKEGIINFKLRSYGSFGIKLGSPSGEQINYSIIVHAGEPRKEHLGNPFTQIKESEKKAGSNAETSSSGEGGGNTVLYVLLGVALLVIGLLAGKLMGRKNTNIIVFIMMAAGGYAQSGAFSDGQFFNPQDLDNGVYEDAISEQSGYDPSEDLENVSEFINNGRNQAQNIIDLYRSYIGLGDCMNSAPLPGSPTIPSFCEDEDSDCANCFLEARREFNEVRYLLEELRTIYNCTKSFSGKAISFGDNVSGIHGVSGLVWQEQRRGIEKSLSDLENAYDQKYAELMQRLLDAMNQLNQCEAQYGVEDWYDRFGYMYFEFMKSAYARSK